MSSNWYGWTFLITHGSDFLVSSRAVLPRARTGTEVEILRRGAALNVLVMVVRVFMVCVEGGWSRLAATQQVDGGLSKISVISQEVLPV